VALGCNNGCPGCYGPLAFHKKDWTNVKVAPDINVCKIEQDIAKLKPKGVFMSFATDPYLECNLDNTYYIGDNLIERNIKVAVLSHLVDPAQLSFANSPDKERTLRFEGRTIVSFDPGYYKLNEPRASKPQERLDDLAKAPYRRWISCEP
jgi:DNA repair photolyase